MHFGAFLFVLKDQVEEAKTYSDLYTLWHADVAALRANVCVDVKNVVSEVRRVAKCTSAVLDRARASDPGLCILGK